MRTSDSRQRARRPCSDAVAVPLYCGRGGQVLGEAWWTPTDGLVDVTGANTRSGVRYDPPQPVRDTYLDTADRRLAAAGVTLRRRQFTPAGTARDRPTGGQLLDPPGACTSASQLRRARPSQAPRTQPSLSNDHSANETALGVAHTSERHR